ncbi:hypothetical protein [Rhizomonospora bruguierae]|uniref:hypothetical protein n=1 Tax=Rhizomonospora bruguierae TaxID=1581705 RepID=UPI001BCBF76A|nr:hypothetical protein [Micromonospora sp. NBRC 107566]
MINMVEQGPGGMTCGLCRHVVAGSYEVVVREDEMDPESDHCLVTALLDLPELD